MKRNYSTTFLLKALAVTAFAAATAACGGGRSAGGGGTPSPTPTASGAPPLTTVARPAAPPAADVSDLTQVGAAVTVTARTSELTFTTPAIADQTKVRVTVPADYDPNGTKRYPVVYLLHGGGSNYTSWTSAGINLEDQTPTTQAIFVMPDAAGVPAGGVGNYVDWYNQGAFGQPQIATYQIRQLVPWIDQHYKTVAHRNARATAGHSMGGHGAFEYARRFPDLIGVSASFSGAFDNTQPLSDWRGGGAAIARNIWGDYASEEVRWRSTGSVDGAKNLSNTKLWISYGDTGAPESTYIKPGALAVRARLDLFKIPYALKEYPGLGHNGARQMLIDWLADAVPFLTDASKHTQLKPSSFSYSTIDPNYAVYGWNVGVTRANLEFSALEVADQTNFSYIGSGTATVQTAPLPLADAIYKVTLTGGESEATKTIYVKTDAAGRATRSTRTCWRSSRARRSAEWSRRSVERRSPRATGRLVTVESEEAHGTADRAPQLSWAKRRGMSVSACRLPESVRLRRFSRPPRETLANLSITGHLRRFSNQPVAEIVQCGEPAP